MKTKIFRVFLPILVLSGCSSPHITREIEPLTGQEYCAIRKNRLTPLKGCQQAELFLKASSQFQKGEAVKATLTIELKGESDYTINPQETLIVKIDNISYPLEILSTIKNPHEVRETYQTSGISFGVVREVTSRKISFYLSQEMIKKILTAKRVHFEIDVPSSFKTSEKYPIQAQLEAENISIIQEFYHTCINPIIKGKENEKH